MDLSKKTLIAALVSLFFAAVMSSIIVFIGINAGRVDQKAVTAFQLIFSLGAMVGSGASSFFMYRDGMMENKHYIILGAIFIIGFFGMVSSSILLDAMNNPYSATLSGANAAIILPAISGIINIPALVGAGYLLAE